MPISTLLMINFNINIWWGDIKLYKWYSGSCFLQLNWLGVYWNGSFLREWESTRWSKMVPGDLYSLTTSVGILCMMLVSDHHHLFGFADVQLQTWASEFLQNLSLVQWGTWQQRQENCNISVFDQVTVGGVRMLLHHVCWKSMCQIKSQSTCQVWLWVLSPWTEWCCLTQIWHPLPAEQRFSCFWASEENALFFLLMISWSSLVIQGLLLENIDKRWWLS